VCRWREYIEERCVEERRCCNCGGDHDPKFLECPVRVKEIEVANVRAVNQISYVEGIKRIEKTSDAPQRSCKSKGTPCVKNVNFVAFMATGTNCTALKIVKDPSHPSHRLFSLLPHGKQYRSAKKCFWDLMILHLKTSDLPGSP
jgi:hypothetical protein